MSAISERMNGKRILIVDDEHAILDLISKRLTMLGYQCETETDGLRAIHRVKGTQYDIVILDVNMPYMTGTEMLLYLRKIDPDIPVLMISGMDSIDLVRKTLREGAYDYLVKPLSFDELELSLKRALEHSYMSRQIKQYQRNLEQQVNERTKELAEALERIKETYDATILALGSALETRDIETQAHGLRVAHFSYHLARKIGIADQDQLTTIERGAYLHDIGKIGVPDAILRKPGALTDEEWDIMRQHPTIGKEIIEGIDFLKDTIPIVYCHHEHFNGAGYPEGIVGEDIPLEARIFAVADAMDAITSERPYKAALPMSVAKERIQADSGKQFDPRIVDALFEIPEHQLHVSFFTDESKKRSGLTLASLER